LLARFAALLFLLALDVAQAFGPMAPSPNSPKNTDFTPGGTQPGLLYSIDGNSSCESCHRGFSASDRRQLPYEPWSGSMMANSVRDPLFWAAVDIANKDVPGIGDWCLRCHAPSAWLQGRVVKDGAGGTNANGALGCALAGDQDDNDGKLNDYAGIGCHFCHRVMPSGPQGQPAQVFNATVWFDDSADCNGEFGPCRRGPYNYPSQTPTGTIQAPPHGWKFDPTMSKSEFCGVCHDISPPGATAGTLRNLILPNGTDSGRPFPLDRTMSEWRLSDFSDVIFANSFRTEDLLGLAKGETCQSCHMPNSSEATARACVFEPEGSRTNNLRVHEFVGSNAFIPAVIKGEYGSPSQLDRVAAFDQTIAWTRANLQRSAAVQTTLDPYTPGGATLTARVKVTNLTGHKLPGGFIEGRRIWIHAQARDVNGMLIWQSGAYDNTTGVLSTDPQLKVYEAVHGVWQRFGQTNQCVTTNPGNGKKLFNFALHNCIVKDNRIPPKGFRGGGDVEVRPVNYTYPETTPGSGRLVNFDTTTYAIPIPPGTPGPITVTATLRSQTVSKDYAEFLRDDSLAANIPSENQMCSRTSTVGPGTQSRAQFFYDLWVEYGRDVPEPMPSGSASTTP
jgi:hypothetical protein